MNRPVIIDTAAVPGGFGIDPWKHDFLNGAHEAPPRGLPQPGGERETLTPVVIASASAGVVSGDSAEGVAPRSRWKPGTLRRPCKSDVAGSTPAGPPIDPDLRRLDAGRIEAHRRVAERRAALDSIAASPSAVPCRPARTAGVEDGVAGGEIRRTHEQLVLPILSPLLNGETWARLAVADMEAAEVAEYGGTAETLRAAIDAVLERHPEVAGVYELVRLGIHPGGRR